MPAGSDRESSVSAKFDAHGTLLGVLLQNREALVKRLRYVALYVRDFLTVIVKFENIHAFWVFVYIYLVPRTPTLLPGPQLYLPAT